MYVLQFYDIIAWNLKDIKIYNSARILQGIFANNCQITSFVEDVTSNDLVRFTWGPKIKKAQEYYSKRIYSSLGTVKFKRIRTEALVKELWVPFDLNSLRWSLFKSRDALKFSNIFFF